LLKISESGLVLPPNMILVLIPLIIRSIGIAIFFGGSYKYLSPRFGKRSTLVFLTTTSVGLLFFVTFSYMNLWQLMEETYIIGICAGLFFARIIKR